MLKMIKKHQRIKIVQDLDQEIDDIGQEVDKEIVREAMNEDVVQPQKGEDHDQLIKINQTN